MRSTPGPWYAECPEWANGWWIVATDPDGNNSVDESGDGGFSEGNARLIAAAPDMLAVLKEAVAHNQIVEGPEWWGRVMAAIAKAEGRP